MLEILPRDEFNESLVSLTHPADYQNPKPTGKYNLVVIGAGTAGLVSAAGAVGLGAKVALIEKHFTGGDCLNFGCVPSKALLHSAKAIHAVREAAKAGIVLGGDPTVDFPAVMRRLRRLRAQIAPNDSVQRFTSLGVDVYLGSAKFLNDCELEVAGEKLSFARAVVATGARPAPLTIPGIEETGYLTNETVFSLTELPAKLAIIGGGPIGCELAQAFARLGSKVTLFVDAKGILPRDDREARKIIESALVRDGVEIINGYTLSNAKKSHGQKVLIAEKPEAFQWQGDEILLAVGRLPNVTGLGLENVDVKFDEKQGIQVDDFLRTTNRRIFAAGDVASKFKFTHAADAYARVVLRNALFFGWERVSALTIPWCTYTDPEVAQVGITEADAIRENLATNTFEFRLEENDRAILEGQTEGFAKIICDKRKGKILGATVVAAHAGDLLAEITSAMVAGQTVSHLGRTIHSYPTQGEVVKRLGDQYARTKLTPTVKAVFRTLLGWRLSWLFS